MDSYHLRLAAILLTGTVFHSSYAIAEPEAMELSGDLEVDFSYIDELQNPKGANTFIGGAMPLNYGAVASARTLGLSRFRAALAWRLVDRSEFTAVFRPDALAWSSELPNKVLVPDHDSRAGLKSAVGGPYRSAPTIKFVDAYEANYLASRQLKLGIGVRESSYRLHSAYDPSLIFGLNVLLPRSFNAASIQWSGLDSLEGFRPGVAQSGYRTAIAVTNGRGDRGESLEFSRASEDYAPTSADPYLGVLVDVEWIEAEKLDVGLVAGYRSARDPLGRVTEFYSQLHMQGWLNTDVMPLTIALDARYAKESWISEQYRVAGLVQQSASITTAGEVAKGHHIGIGYHQGTSGRHRDVLEPDKTNEVSGWQVDTQYRRQFDQSLAFIFSAAHESRSLNQSGVTTGGFDTGVGDPRNFVRRFAIEILYRTGLTR